ncbi:MAG: hypothetical protein CL535_16190 [Ahrensia sp.]|nr:hypothetical protein [Ahrensia sp.]MBV48213.1 hypothetical protein [Roseobacter sp.]|tara:strand:+ start:98652 stop:99008 length:357 start_codon:yes stop_codon:yes gene_type:complete
MNTRETKWTPGPWFVEQSTSREWSGFRIHSASETYDFDAMKVPQSIAITTQNYDGTTYATIKGRQEANAHLIAAAPELYAALVEAIDELEAYEVDASGELYNNPRFNAILAKARGESQ